MKVIIFVPFILFLLNLIAAEMTKEQIKQITDGILQECKTETKAKDEDLAIFNQRKLPGSHEGLCMVECFLDKIGIMNDGKFDKDALVEALATVIKDDNEMKKLKILGNYCDNKIGKGMDDRCENAKLVLTCLVIDGKKQGFDFIKHSVG